MPDKEDITVYQVAVAYLLFVVELVTDVRLWLAQIPLRYVLIVDNTYKSCQGFKAIAGL